MRMTIAPRATPGVAVADGASGSSTCWRPLIDDMLSEVAAVRPLAVKLSEMVLSRLWDRFANVTTPLTAVAVKVPCSVPLPALRVTVTTVLLSL
jgi:hypothetical protein